MADTSLVHEEIGVRLREERERIGLKQDELGLIGGVNRNSQGKYEKGERSPDAAYLSGVAAAGIDVLYVLTGHRTPQLSSAISAEETQILDYVRQLPSIERAGLLRLVSALAATVK